MSLVALLFVAGVVGLALGAVAGMQVAGWLTVAGLAVWFAGFLIAAALGAEPATTLLGWGMALALPVGGVVVAGAGIGGSMTKRGRPNPKAQTATPVGSVLPVSDAIVEAYRQFRSGELVSVRCPKCRGLLQASVHKSSATTVVACPCNACRRDFREE